MENLPQVWATIGPATQEAVALASEAHVSRLRGCCASNSARFGSYPLVIGSPKRIRRGICGTCFSLVCSATAPPAGGAAGVAEVACSFSPMEGGASRESLHRLAADIDEAAAALAFAPLGHAQTQFGCVRGACRDMTPAMRGRAGGRATVSAHVAATQGLRSGCGHPMATGWGHPMRSGHRVCHDRPIGCG